MLDLHQMLLLFIYIVIKIKFSINLQKNYKKLVKFKYIYFYQSKTNFIYTKINLIQIKMLDLLNFLFLLFFKFNQTYHSHINSFISHYLL